MDRKRNCLDKKGHCVGSMDRSNAGLISVHPFLLVEDGNGVPPPKGLNTWSDNEVRELIAVKVLDISLLNITVAAFRVLPLGSYAPIPAPSPLFKTVLELVL
jgi:hypothetical protein